MSAELARPDQQIRPSLPRRIRTVLVYSLWLVWTFVASQLAAYVVILLINQLGISVTDYVNENVFVIILGVLTYVVMTVATLQIPAWYLNRPTTKDELGVQRPPNWRDIVVAPAGMVVYFVLTAILLTAASMFLPWIDLDQTQDTGIIAPSQGFEIALVFLLFVVVAPVIEELLFRGYLYGKLRSRGVSFLVTTLIVSVLFGIAHMQWNVGFDTFALSIVMCITRELTGVLWPSILMHMMKNGIAFYFLFINPQILQGLTG